MLLSSAILEARSARVILSDLILAEEETQAALLEELAESGDQVIAEIYEAWRSGGVYTLSDDSGTRLLLFNEAQEWTLVATGEVVSLSEAEASAVEKERASRAVRKLMKSIVDTLGLKSVDERVRIDAALKLGLSQKPEYIEPLKARLETEPSKNVLKSIREALAISLLVNGEGDEVFGAVKELTSMKSIAARGFLEKLIRAEEKAGRLGSEVVAASSNALLVIEEHINMLEFFGSFFRGFSTGSVLLIVSFGLAITFGLMGIINMAHGEFVAIGGYVTFMVQTFFINTWGLSSSAFGWYFVVSLPLSFLVAAGIGLLLEKSIIRFLYRRPLESLLCTWGISMIMQQCFRLIFGAANVQVNNPTWLMGSLNFGGFNMSYTRLFIMFIALVVVIMTWLLLRKTNLGLHIRAVMQNRGMASSLGIPVARVNSMTFALGCGLAALGGSVLSQIGNVGPLMGQAYIVDSFMVVVIGSVGNLLGAGLSAMGIGLVDQLLQPSLGPVMGKITVFFVIILFLQWRPGGLFPSRSRSLDD
ncbi:MAG: urea ABC transporter permease subunit UrtB [Opitutales bacterium]|nr:urea ABC transporter permease subunit UrtB [Opitutales bacterium]